MRKNNPFLNWTGTAVLLMALWFIMSGKTEPKFLILGALSSALIASLCLRTLTMRGMKTDRDYYLAGASLPRFILYFLWLLGEIAKAAFYVARISVSDKKRVEPSIIWFRADYDNPAARAMLANSITLTPGTITIDITEDGIYSVHALTGELKDGLLDGSMQAKVAWLYGEKIDYAVMSEEDAWRGDSVKRPELIRRRHMTRRKSI